jgi:hypothetical protein
MLIWMISTKTIEAPNGGGLYNSGSTHRESDWRHIFDDAGAYFLKGAAVVTKAFAKVTR